MKINRELKIYNLQIINGVQQRTKVKNKIITHNFSFRTAIFFGGRFEKKNYLKTGITL